MRRFLLLAHRVPVEGNFTLNDLAGGAGRMDEVARCVSTAFTLSNDLRRDVEFTVLFAAAPPPRARRITLDGRRLRYLNPDERSTAALLKNALVQSIADPGPFEASPGLTVASVDPLPWLEEFARTPGTLWLTEGGRPVRDIEEQSPSFSAVLSDPTDPTEVESELLGRSGARPVSVGPRSLRSSQCIDLLHGEWDLRERRGAEAPLPTAGSGDAR